LTTAPAYDAAGAPASPPEPAIDVRQVSKNFGRLKALDDVSLQVNAGQCLVLFGPNGAGKTTLISILSTLALPTSGTAFICGFDVRNQSRDVRRAIGVISHESFVYDSMTAVENLRFFARMYGAPGDRPGLEQSLGRVGLLHRADSPAGTMSRGMKQRLSLARCLLHEPRVVLLDEPYSGLDLDGAELLTCQIRDLCAGGRAVLVTTHQLSAGLSVADELAILARGKLRFRAGARGISEAEFQHEYAKAVAEPAP